MSFRNNFAVHSGAKKIEFSRVVVVLDSKKNNRNLPLLTGELLQPDSMGIEETESFLELAEHAREFAIKKRDKLHGIIYQEDILRRGRDYWYKKV